MASAIITYKHYTVLFWCLKIIISVIASYMDTREKNIKLTENSTDINTINRFVPGARYRQ